MRVNVANQDPKQRRLEDAKDDARHAQALLDNPSFAWLMQLLEEAAQGLQADLLAVSAKMDARDEDRYRGTIAGLRGIPGRLHKVIVEYDRRVEKAKQQQEQQQRQLQQQRQQEQY